MSLQNIGDRISRIEQRVSPSTLGKVHMIYEVDPDIGARKAAEMEATLPENDLVVLVTGMRPKAVTG